MRKGIQRGGIKLVYVETLKQIVDTLMNVLSRDVHQVLGCASGVMLAIEYFQVVKAELALFLF